MTITGNLEGSVLLPCNCLQRNLDEEFLWQREEPRTILVVKNTKNTSNYNSGYKDRAKLFLHENSNNCSILLTNITVDDQGRYRCKFYKKKTYMRVFVNLNINGESIIHYAYNIQSLVHSPMNLLHDCTLLTWVVCHQRATTSVRMTLLTTWMLTKVERLSAAMQVGTMGRLRFSGSWVGSFLQIHPMLTSRTQTPWTIRPASTN